MLGERTRWVANVRAANGRATLVHGRPESVRLLDVDDGAHLDRRPDRIGTDRRLDAAAPRDAAERSDLRAEVLTGYLMALMGMMLLYASGVVLGVRLELWTWLEMTGLMLVALLPFAALGVLLGIS